MTENSIKETAFQLNSELIENINKLDSEALKETFGINPAVLEEIKEELFDYFQTSNLPQLKIDPAKFSIFKYNTAEGFGIEAGLFIADGKETELTLHTEFDNNQLKFKLIEVM